MGYHEPPPNVTPQTIGFVLRVYEPRTTIAHLFYPPNAISNSKIWGWINSMVLLSPDAPWCWNMHTYKTGPKKWSKCRCAYSSTMVHHGSNLGSIRLVIRGMISPDSMTNLPWSTFCCSPSGSPSESATVGGITRHFCWKIQSGSGSGWDRAFLGSFLYS